MFLIKYFCPGEENGFESDYKAISGTIKYNMRKDLDLDQEGCYLQTGKKDQLENCGFNATAKTIFIIHGWTVNGVQIFFSVYFFAPKDYRDSFYLNALLKKNLFTFPFLLFMFR